MMTTRRRPVKYKAPVRMIEVTAEEVAETAVLARIDAIPPYLSMYDEVMFPAEVATALKRTTRSILADRILSRARLKSMNRVSVRFSRSQLASLTMGLALVPPPVLARHYTALVLSDAGGTVRLHVTGTALAKFVRVRSLAAITALRPRPPIARHIHPPRHRHTPSEVLAFMSALLTTSND